jgi:phosphoserine phosphatase
MAKSPATAQDAGGNRPSAAFYRVEGTLVKQPSIAAAAYMAANAQGLGQRMARLGNVALAAPLALAGRVSGASTAARATWMGLRGMGEDRIAELAREYYQRHLEPGLLDVGLDLVSRSKKQGHRIVLVSDNIHRVLAPLAERLGADELVCNHLELRRGEATGRLLDPVIGGNLTGQWARAYADRHDLDLGRCAAYGATGADGLLLSAIGQPCAVNPDPWLRQIARDHEWPVVEA